jgi:hypothetical protein
VLLVGWFGFACLVGSGYPLDRRPVASGPASGPGKGRRRRACAFQAAATKAQREAWQKEETTSLLLFSSSHRRCSQLFLPGVGRRLFTADSFALRSDLSAAAKFSHFDAVCGFASSNQNLCCKKIVSGITESYHSLSLQKYYLSGDPYHSFSLQLFS